MSAEDDIDAFVLDLGQVLPYAGPGSSASAATAMTQTEAAWICPIALHLVRFARSKHWVKLAALIMPIAAAGSLFVSLMPRKHIAHARNKTCTFAFGEPKPTWNHSNFLVALMTGPWLHV